jgi:hypothetical protein
VCKHECIRLINQDNVLLVRLEIKRNMILDPVCVAFEVVSKVTLVAFHETLVRDHDMYFAKPTFEA